MLIAQTRSQQHSCVRCVLCCVDQHTTHTQHSNSTTTTQQHKQQIHLFFILYNRTTQNLHHSPQAKKTGKKVNLKRQPAGPRGAQFVKKPVVETLFAETYKGINV